MSMCSASKHLEAVGLIVVLCAVIVAQTSANSATTPTQVNEPVVLQENVISATGQGAMPTEAEEPNRAKAYLQAKAYAKMQAIANLVQSVRGTAINCRATGSGYTSDEEISQDVEGVVDSVRVTSERKIQIGKDTIVEVTVSVPIPPDWRDLPASPTANRVASASLDASWIQQPGLATIDSLRRATETPYTSVIINARGLGVERSMSPKILRSDGSEVWGTLSVDYDFVADHGIAAYARSIDEAYANRRAGANPLVLRALRCGNSPCRSRVVISTEDARYLLAESERSGFLDDFRVIIVIDRQ